MQTLRVPRRIRLQRPRRLATGARPADQEHAEHVRGLRLLTDAAHKPHRPDSANGRAVPFPSWKRSGKGGDGDLRRIPAPPHARAMPGIRVYREHRSLLQHPGHRGLLRVHLQHSRGPLRIHPGAARPPVKLMKKQEVPGRKGPAGPPAPPHHQETILRFRRLIYFIAFTHGSPYNSVEITDRSRVSGECGPLLARKNTLFLGSLTWNHSTRSSSVNASSR